MREITKTILGVAAAVLIVDALGFLIWVASNQYPADDFFVGAIMARILRAIL